MYLHCRSSPHEEECADLRREFSTILRSPGGKTRINGGGIRGEGSGSIKEKLCNHLTKSGREGTLSLEVYKPGNHR